MRQHAKSTSSAFPWKEFLGFLGVILAAYIGYLGIRSQIEIPIRATQTAEARLTGIASISNMTQSAIPPLATWTPSPTDTAIPPVTETNANVVPTILLQDEFIDNRNGWLLQDEKYIKSDIIGGRYKHTIICPADYKSAFCGHYFLAPYLSAQNLRFEIDATIKNISPLAGEVKIAFLFRMNNNNYYDVYFRSRGEYSVSIVHNGSLEKLLELKPIPSFSPNSDTVNRYGFSAIGPLITPLFNGQELLSVEDGNINRAGPVQIAIYVSKGSSATVELDNLLATDKSAQ